MQATEKKAKILFLLTIIAAALLTSLRTLLMLNGFDFETKFYTSNTTATLLYVLTLIVCLLVFFTSKKIQRYSNVYTSVNNIYYLISSFLFILFFVNTFMSEISTVNINKALHYVSLISSAVSVVFYLLSAFLSKSRNHFALKLMGIAPITYFLSELIVSFTSTSGKANSYYLFPNVISTIIITYLIITLLKSDVDDTSVFSPALISIIILAFSAIPDTVFLIMGRYSFTIQDISALVFKFLYLVYSTIIATSVLNTAEEE